MIWSSDFLKIDEIVKYYTNDIPKSKCLYRTDFDWSDLYEIRAASSEDCVFVPPNSYDVTAP